MKPSAHSRRAPTLCGLAAALLLAFAETAAGSEPTLWQRIRADPRAAQLAMLSPAERRAFARDYGIENLLPKTGATTIPVANCNDAGAGSLRAAVASAASGDTIDATALACSRISLTTGAIETALDDLSIKGRGPGALTITANDHSRVFTHTGTGALRLYGMTLEHGRFAPADTTPARGGCVYSSGSVYFGNGKYAPADRQQGVVARNCVAHAQAAGTYASGGAVFAKRGLGLFASVISDSEATMDGTYSLATKGGGAALMAQGVSNATFMAKYSEIRDNTTSDASGGLYVYAKQAALASSTIAGNTAHRLAGGACLHTPPVGTVIIQNTTISGNSTLEGVGGVQMPYRAHSVLVANSTITGNATSGGNNPVGGARLYADAIEMESSIFCGNHGMLKYDLLAVTNDEVGADQQVTGANNLLGSGAYAPQDTISCPDASLVLAPLADNGGPTRTHALLPGSPAIDAGNNSQNVGNDQRGAGHPRVLGAAADIGAYERDPDLIFRNGFD